MNRCACEELVSWERRLAWKWVYGYIETETGRDAYQVKVKGRTRSHLNDAEYDFTTFDVEKQLNIWRSGNEDESEI